MGLTSQLPGVGSLTAIPLADLSTFAACLVDRLFSVSTWKPKRASLHLGVLLCVNNQISFYKKQKQTPSFPVHKTISPPNMTRIPECSSCHLSPSLPGAAAAARPFQTLLTILTLKRKGWHSGGKGEPRAVNLPLLS